MKVLQICTTNSGGAGIAARRINSGLKSIGIDAKILLLNRCKTCGDSKDIVEFTQKKSLAKRVLDKLYHKFITVEYDAYRNARPQGLDIFSDDRTIYDISEHPLVKDADLVTLCWVAGMVNPIEFCLNTKNKPIVWRLSDMNPFTGGCHYSCGCTKYETGCGACPQLGSNYQNDLSRKIFKRKEKAYKNCNIHIVAISRWQADRARRSPLFKNFKIDIIPNGLPTDIFKKRDKKFSRDLLSLPQDKTLILFGCEGMLKRKGFEYLREALKLIKKRSPSYNIALVTFGAIQDIDTLSKDVEFPIYQLGYIYNEALLCDIYSSCDMFIIPSLEEAFGQVCIESMACGTPPIGFNTGGMQDMIIPQQTGLLAELKNERDLADKIEYMVTHPKEREAMGESARRRVEQEYTLQVQAKRYLELYEKLLKG